MKESEGAGGVMGVISNRSLIDRKKPAETVTNPAQQDLENDLKPLERRTVFHDGPRRYVTADGQLLTYMSR